MSVSTSTFRAPILMGMALLSGLLCSCASNPEPSTFEELGTDANTSGFGRRFPSPRTEEGLFTYGVGDQLVIRIAEFEDLSAEATVLQDGTIEMGFLGTVQVGGLTGEQIQRKVATLATLYVTEPEVSVTPIKIVSKKVFFGAVDLKAGSLAFQALPLEGDYTLFDLWVDIGSPSTALDDIQSVKVIRGDPRFPQVYVINLEDMARNGRTGANIQLRADDIVFVPPSLLGRINQAITAIGLPLTSVTEISRSFISIERTIRILEGDSDNFSRVLL